jgi:aliphatic nitrilase
MMTGTELVRVAAVQAAPVFLDPGATLEKAVGLVEEAAAQGARLVAFGEGFLPAHPIWLHVLPVTSPRQIELAAALVAAAIRIPGPETVRLGEVARGTGATIVLGAVERLSETSSPLALTAIVATPDGVVAGRRKLVPAVGERVLFTPGEGDAIRVFETPLGRLSVLLGGENSNPLLTWTMRELGARLHVAAWPPHFNKPGVMGETAAITGRAIAYQNTAYVISVTGATTPEMREQVAGTDADRALLERMAADPGSVIYAPRGALLAGPHDGGEGILYADLDLSAGAWAGLVNRHYDRPDLFRVTIDRSVRSSSLVLRDGGAPDDLEQRARQLIDDRYGATLAADDRERLLPFVVSVLETSARLEELEPSTMDPTTTAFADDPRWSQ